jgi:hypothetical protein
MEVAQSRVDLAYMAARLSALGEVIQQILANPPPDGEEPPTGYAFVPAATVMRLQQILG